MKKRIAVIVGARPQFVKIMPLAKKIRSAFDLKIIHTGQHYDHKMSQIFFNELDIPVPDYNLNVGSAGHGAQTGKMLERIEKVLAKCRPALVIVIGDTNSTLAGALAAAKMNIPIAHVESGLRSFRRSMPEEINRVVSDHLSSILFCPTVSAVKNLSKEGIRRRVVMTGDIMCDALKSSLAVCRKNKKIIDKFGVRKGGYYLFTLHRDFNTDSPAGLKSLLRKLAKLDKRVIFPMHPRTKAAIRSYGLLDMLKKNANVLPVEPQGYIDFLTLEMNAAAIITDSGGVQKEAYLLKVRCVTLRDETEWPETLRGNASRLAGRYGRRLMEEMRAMKKSRRWKEDIYGKGDASQKMLNEIRKFFGNEK